MGAAFYIGLLGMINQLFFVHLDNSGKTYDLPPVGMVVVAYVYLLRYINFHWSCFLMNFTSLNCKSSVHSFITILIICNWTVIKLKG